MKHLKTFETFVEQDIMVDEGWKEFKSTITKPFRDRTPEEIEKDAENIINTTGELLEIEEVLKNHNNPNHYKNYMNAKKEYSKGNKNPFYNFVLFVRDNLSDFETNRPLYYSFDPISGELEDTRQVEFDTGVGGRKY